MNAPVLQLPDIEKPFRVETDASDFALAGVLLQPEILDSDSCWHPVAYMSRKLSSAECNYTAADRETLAVVHALKCWRIYLFDHFDVITDNMGVFHLELNPISPNVKLDGRNFWLILISMCIIHLELII